ncbi:MAG: hypothetical protein ACFFCZ_00390 [Promethearchaeota archaeon]
MNKTFSWIARQPYSVRYGKHKIKTDYEPESEEFLRDVPLAKNIEFERGIFWPTMILVENLWSRNPKDIDIFLRLFRKNRDIIVDIWKGHDVIVASDLAKKFNIPIYSIYENRTGKRSYVRRIRAEMFD